MLASASPRRRELLSGLGLARLGYTLRLRPADIDEAVLPGEAPAALVARLAAGKAAAAAQGETEALVVAADTVVVLGAEILGKPADEAENRDYLRRLSGATHEVFSGHALRLGGAGEDFVVRTAVTFRPLAADEIVNYAATGEGLDKAGGYAIQGMGAALVAGIEGCYSNVVGLSLPGLVSAARRLGASLV